MGLKVGMLGLICAVGFVLYLNPQLVFEGLMYAMPMLIIGIVVIMVVVGIISKLSFIVEDLR